MSVSINGTSGLVFNDASTQNTSAFTGGFAFRNRIINGAMVIDQRNAGASVSVNGQYTLDRWYGGVTQASKYSIQQNAGSITPPTGFANYLGVTSSSAYSVLTGDAFSIQQPIEGFNTADLGWGTAGAQTVTLSFWIRSSLTGTFGGALSNNALNRSYPFSFTISAANTWENKSVTIAGDTSGTWLSSNNVGIRVWFGLGAGSTYSGTAGAWAAGNFVSATGATSVVGTNGATFYITGVQLEKGSTATSFDYRPYGTELALCQRYFCKSSSTNVVATNGTVYTSTGMFMSGTANAYTANACYVQMLKFPVTMRVEPSTYTFINTSLPSSPTSGAWSMYTGSAWANGVTNVQAATTEGFNLYLTGTWPTGAFMWYGAWTASSEL